MKSSQPWSSQAIIKPAELRFAYGQLSEWELRELCADCLEGYSLKGMERMRPLFGMPP